MSDNLDPRFSQLAEIDNDLRFWRPINFIAVPLGLSAMAVSLYTAFTSNVPQTSNGNLFLSGVFGLLAFVPPITTYQTYARARALKQQINEDRRAGRMRLTFAIDAQIDTRNFILKDLERTAEAHHGTRTGRVFSADTDQIERVETVSFDFFEASDRNDFAAAACELCRTPISIGQKTHPLDIVSSTTRKRDASGMAACL